MRIIVHDYPGHPFQVQLSRELARRSHTVLHLYAGYNVTPRGPLTRSDDDPESFSIRPIFIREPLQKYSFVKRWFQEHEYGRLLAREISNFRPSVVILSNTPLDTQAVVFKSCEEHKIRFVRWLQDVISVATYDILRGKIPILGALIGKYYLRMERQLLDQSDGVVLISEDFLPILSKWGVSKQTMSVVQNWAPIEQIPVCERNNPWAASHGLIDKLCFLYSGTLGLKHNPSLLLGLAFHFRNNPMVQILVISEGPGAEWLAVQKEEHGLENLILLDYQPFELMPHVLASGDVLVGILNPDAGVFSVPSKVLTYLCAQRPLLLAVPKENLAAKIVTVNGAGLVVDPKDNRAFLCAAERLVDDKDLREDMALKGRAYAESNFQITTITDRFEELLLSLNLENTS